MQYSGSTLINVFGRYGRNPSGGKLPIMPAVGRNGVDLYAQTAASGAWVWAGNIGGVTDPDASA